MKKTITIVIILAGLSASVAFAQQEQSSPTATILQTLRLPSDGDVNVAALSTMDPRWMARFAGLVELPDARFAPFHTFPKSDNKDVDDAVRAVTSTLNLATQDWDNAPVYFLEAFRKLEALTPFIEEDATVKAMHTFGNAYVCAAFVASGTITEDTEVQKFAKAATDLFDVFFEDHSQFPRVWASASLASLYVSEALNEPSKGLELINQALAGITPARPVFHEIRAQLLFDLDRHDEGCEALGKAKAAGFSVDRKFRSFGCE